MKSQRDFDCTIAGGERLERQFLCFAFVRLLRR